MAQPLPNRKQIARQLKEAARLLELLGDDPFRARAFERAARGFDTYEGDLEAAFREDRLTDVPGVGRGLAEELKSLQEQDTLPILETLHERVPEGVRELFRVSGLGAKRIATLWEAGIDDLERLVEAARHGRVATLRGFGKASANAVLAGAEFAMSARSRLAIDAAEALAALVRHALHERLPNARIELAGEARRGCETVAGLEFVASGVDAAALGTALPDLLEELTRDGPDDAPLLRGVLANHPVSFVVVADDAVGAALAVRTGGPDYAERLTARARERGLELTARGLERDGERIVTPDETALFRELELEPVPPERREWADPRPVDGLVTLPDVRGVVHVHTSWSDGALPLREMVRAAQDAGFAYLAIADHSRSSQVANGLSVERLRQQAKEIRAVREELRSEGSDFGLLHGSEVDILNDGKLDYPDDVLEALDYTVISVHQNFGLSEAQQTKRIVKAVRNPHATILAHPTGRLLLRRPSYALDLEEVIGACAETGTVIEINANPRRLDLDWRWVVRAKETGCSFAVNPDAHHSDGYADLRFGVAMARKAGLTPADVVTCARNAEAFLARLKPRPQAAGS